MILSILTSAWYRELALNLWIFRARIYGRFLRMIGLIKAEKGVGPIFVDPSISWVLEKGSSIFVKKSLNELKNPMISKYPKGVFIGGFPQWHLLNPPVSRRTTIRLKENSKLILGPNVLICKGAYISVWPSKTLEIESNNYLGHEIYLNTKMGLKLSDNVMTSHKVTMMDYDGHPIVNINKLSGHIPTTESYGGSSEEIKINKNVWIGFEATILKGASIGEGSIIGARSVVTDSRTENTISAGNPAKTIKEGVSWQMY